MSINSSVVCVWDSCGAEHEAASTSESKALGEAGKKGWVKVQITSLDRWLQYEEAEFIFCAECHPSFNTTLVGRRGHPVAGGVGALK